MVNVELVVTLFALSALLLRLPMAAGLVDRAVVLPAEPVLQRTCPSCARGAHQDHENDDRDDYPDHDPDPRIHLDSFRLPGNRRGRTEMYPVMGSRNYVNFERNSSFTTFGSALPCVSFITWPTKKPSRPSLPPLYAATWPGLSARMRSTSGSSSAVSATKVSPRYVSARNSGSALSASARMNVSRGIVERAAISFASSAPLTAAGSTPVATKSFIRTFDAAFAST